MFSACTSPEEGTTGPTDPPVLTGSILELNYTGPSDNLRVVYAAWLEDAQGNNVQNLYICNMAANNTLMGDGLPVWSTLKRVQNGNIDGVTGASVQGSIQIRRTISVEMDQELRVCFEIDRSRNGNAYFTDRPAFLYRSSLINFSQISAETNYDLSLYAWMANDTEHSTYGQQPPLQTITGFETYKLMTDLSYIAPVDDMVSQLQFKVLQEDQ